MTRTPDNTPDGEDKSKNARAAKDQPDQNAQDALPEYGYHGMEVEPFVPTDVFPSTQVRGKRRHTKKKKRALWALMLVGGIVLLAVGGVFAYALFLDPSTQFSGEVQQNPTEVIAVVDPDETAAPNAPTPTPTLDPYEVISAQADTSMMQNIVNVLLIGVDYAEERETWIGKHEYHSDVMMVMAINFDENRVDLISLPRDTYAKIPGVKGIYKLNASINCGGGFDAPGGAGFLKTCEAASWMLGGIPVNYYYAVTMPAVKELVNAIGGVDYNLDVSYTMMGRSYDAGPTHLNGQGVLDYLRVRKNVQSGGDSNRVNRQKEMLIAIFESMQNQNLILTLDKNNIGMYSMGGSEKNIFNWKFVITDQSNRVKIIKDVYGIDKPREREYTADYAQYRWADIIATQYLDTTRGLVDFVSEALAADDLLPTMEPTPEITPEVTPEYFTAPPTEEPTPTPPTEPTITTGASSSGSSGFSVVRLSAQSPIRGEGYQQYSLASRYLFDDFLMSLDSLEEAQAIARKEAQRYVNGENNDLEQATQDVSDYASHVKTNALQLAMDFGYSTSKFAWTYWFDKDSSFNEVRVDFR